MKTITRSTFKKKSNAGLTLVEVLIVLAISGLTLVALLNLAVRDLQIESLNEEQDVANTASVSLLQQFEHIKNLSPACAATMAGKWTSGTKQTYFICSPANPVLNANAPSTLIQNACENSSAYQITDGGSGSGLGQSFTYVDPKNTSTNAFDCLPAKTGNSNISYQSRLQVINVQNNPNLMTISSDVSFTGLNAQKYSFSLQQQYIF